VLGKDWRLVAYGPDAEARAAEAAKLDFGLRGLEPLAILPNTMNRMACAKGGPEVVRELSREFLREVPEGATVLLLVRPDRYIAAASTRSVDGLAQAVRGLVEALRPA
jgi:3-(3-hydroxy-phenyl)propionate hydroxylase